MRKLFKPHKLLLLPENVDLLKYIVLASQEMQLWMFSTAMGDGSINVDALIT